MTGTPQTIRVGLAERSYDIRIGTGNLDSAGEFLAGLAEVVKYGVILDAGFFDELEACADAVNRHDPEVLVRVIARCCRLKADVVEQDEFETTGVRAALNYGHIFAHAFEALSGYGELLHGEAVAMGMVCASRLAERLGRIDAEVTARQRTPRPPAARRRAARRLFAPLASAARSRIGMRHRRTRAPTLVEHPILSRVEPADSMGV